MFTLEFDSKEPTQKLTEFINSCENKFSKFWDDCPRVDWMLWVLHNKIRYRDTGKILKFAKSLNQEPEETIVVEPELSWEDATFRISRYLIEGALQFANDLEVINKILKDQADLLRNIITIYDIRESFKPIP